jgi:hypothetical protein
MTKKLCLLAFLLLAPLPVFAASFTATVDSTHVTAGEGFSLQLSLSGADAKGNPDLSTLKQSFDIVGQAQTSNTSIINGHMSSSTGWQLALIPKQTGHVTVPPVAVDTDNGRLSTQPITLDVGDATPQQSSQGAPIHAGRDVTISATTNLPNPYQDQPIIYTVRIVAHDSISDLSLGNVTADNAIVQPQGEVETKDALENGVPVKIIEMRYLVTPLKAGTVTIAPVTMQGSIISNAAAQRFNGISNGFIDPMQMFQQMGNFGFMQSKPFSLASNVVTLNVRAPAVAMDPWLPLKEFKIMEKIDASQVIKVGDPIARTFTLLADGMVGSQLPSLDLKLNAADFKVYADKPSTKTSIDKNTGDVIGQREESFSVIPLKPGSLTLPEIKIPWWDVKNDRIAYAEVPARNIDVLPAPISINESTQNALKPQINNVASSPEPQTPHQIVTTSQTPWFWYGLVGVLMLVIVAVALWAINLQRKVNRQNGKVDAQAKNENIKPKPPADIKWDQIRTAEDLHHELLAYAHDHWGMSQNATLEAAFAQQRLRLSNAPEQNEIETISRQLTAALYAGKPIDLEDIKTKCRHMIASLNKPEKDKKDSSEKLPHLNPS